MKLSKTQPMISKNEYKQPLCFRITNTTDEKLYNVNVLNYEYEKQTKMEYMSIISGVTYGDILRHLIGQNEKKENIGKIKVVAKCDYLKFQNKQLESSLLLGEKDILGNSIQRPHDLVISPEQQQDDRAVVECIFPFYSQTTIKMPYLMPETQVTFYIYLLKKAKEEKRDTIKLQKIVKKKII